MANFHKFLNNISISKVFFFILVFLLPLGTKKIFFTSLSFSANYHIFYNSFYLYLSDLLILALIITWIWEKIKISRETFAYKDFFHNLYTKISQDKIYQSLCIFWLILAVSLIVSREKLLSIYGLVKILEFSLFFAYLRENFTSLKSVSREILLIFWLILAIFCFQAVLGISQYFSQKSLDIKIFGEEYLRPGIKGIAEFPSHGLVNPYLLRIFPNLSPISPETINIRAYGTLSHPNVLAGLLFAGLLINLFLLYVSPASPAGRRERLSPLALSLSAILISTGLVVTFSRLAWAVCFFGIVFWFGLAFWKVRKPVFSQMQAGRLESPEQQYFPGRLALIALVLLGSLGINLFLFGPQISNRLGRAGDFGNREFLSQESFSYRAMLNQIAWSMIKSHPLLGVGWKNFIVRMDDFSKEQLLPWQHQPAHNIFLLIAAEAGVLGLFMFLRFLYYIVRRAVFAVENPVWKITGLVIFFGFLAIGMFDHYFWTIQQGALMFWLFLGLLAAK
jgi:hypothetical protein